MAVEPLISHTNPSEVMSFATEFIGAVEDEWQLFSDRPDDYAIGEPIGFGASSIVYLAFYRPANDDTDVPNRVPCALKVLDLDTLPPRSLYLLQRETTLMSLSKHPNVLRVRGSWIAGHKLYIALRLMNKGSAADVMRYGWPGGMEEEVVRCILRQALKGLNYLHINGFIHRDIKAANLLIDDDGTVLLGDLGVAANLAEDTSHTSNSHSHSKFTITSLAESQVNSSSASTSGGMRAILFDDKSAAVPIRPGFGKRKSFVGTPCWMAPELIQGKQYDAKADIWSFGITALELTQGRPPRSRESPQRVLLRTIQEDAPTLDRAGGAHKYSRTFKEIVDWCLNKDPAKRPTAEELLQTQFFKGAKKQSYLINTILKNLPPLTQRQERRALPPIKSATSVDSWDFATTVHSSPTIHRHRVSGEQINHEESIINDIFVMEEDENNVALYTEGPDIEPWSSGSSLRSFELDDAPSSMPNTTPSSYTDTSEMVRIQSVNSLASDPRNTNEYLASIAEHAHQHATAVSRTPPTSRKPMAVVRRPSDSSSSSDGRLNLWQRIKTNVKKSSSSNNLLDAPSPSSSPSNGRMSGMLSASKGFLTGSSGPRI